MRRSEFFPYKTVIPLWWPSERNICIGDIGSFNNEGGFEILFNIFLSAGDNAAHGFNPPVDFEPYPPEDLGEISRVILISKDDYRSCSGFTEDMAPPSGRYVKFISTVALLDMIVITGNTLPRIHYLIEGGRELVPFSNFQTVPGGKKYRTTNLAE